MSTKRLGPLPTSALPAGVRSRIIEGINGLAMHVLEAGYGPTVKPVILLLHGFPELAYCWRRVMPMLAQLGYYVIAPDQRGFGRTSPEPVGFNESDAAYNVLNLVSDMVSLIAALGLKSVDSVVGHDLGAYVAGTAALVRPDMFHRLVLLSTPFTGAPELGAQSVIPLCEDPINAELAKLNPPRKHYLLYYSQAAANKDMWHCPQGVKEFLRGYYYQKSAGWANNVPRPLESWTATQLAQMPDYYCMPAELNMAEVAQSSMCIKEPLDAWQWLSEKDLDVVSKEFERTGFQGGLQWYRNAVSGTMQRSLSFFSGYKIEVPTIFVAGCCDWGTFQFPGALQLVRQGLATQDVPIHFIEGAGHWLQQEQPAALCLVMDDFFQQAITDGPVLGGATPA
jgi:pimeloyl-ACP methyl ester carboxylesterase